MDCQKVQEATSSETGLFYGYVIVIASFFIMVVVFGLYNSFGVFLKPMLAEFGWTRAITAGAFSFCMITQAFLIILMGRLNDRFGPRMVLTLCGSALGLGYLLMSQIVSIWQLYLVFGVIIGIGMSGVFVPLTSTVARWFVDKRSLMTGIVVAGIGVGSFIIPPVANRLISAYNWHVSFVALGSTILIVNILAAQFLKSDPATVGQVAYEVNRKENKKPEKGLSLKEAVNTRRFWQVLTMQFCYAFCLFVITIHIAAHATEIGITASTGANILAFMGGVSIIGKLVFGRIADSIGNKQVFCLGFIMMSAAFLWLMIATNAWMLYLFVAVFGLAYGGMIACQPPLIAQLFGLSSHGVILGVVNFGFTAGGGLGAFIAGHIFDVSGTYLIAFLAAEAVAITGLLLTIMLKIPEREF